MNQLRKEIELLTDAATHPAQTVRQAMEKTQRKAIGCFPLYTPDEVIDAAGFLPIGLWGGQAQTSHCNDYLQSFCCSIMRANFEQALTGQYDFLSAVVVTTYCDTLKCVCENWKAAIPSPPALPIVYPQNRAVGEEYLVEEFKRLAGQLQQLGGKTVEESALKLSIEKFENCRRWQRTFTELAAQHPLTVGVQDRHLILKAAYFMDRSDYATVLQSICEKLNKLPAENSVGPRVVATGLILEPEALRNLLDEKGFCIVADDLAHESRQFRTPIASNGTAWQLLAQRYLNQKADPLICEPEKTRGAHLKALAHDHDADGVMAVMLKFCDPEEFDYPLYKKELEDAQIPLLTLETEQNMTQTEGLRTRLEGFMELIEARK